MREKTLGVFFIFISLFTATLLIGTHPLQLPVQNETLKTSNGDFIIHNPYLGQLVGIGMFMVNWSYTGNPAGVTLNITLYKNGLFVEDVLIGGAGANDGLHLWEIEEDDYIYGGDYQLKLSTGWVVNESIVVLTSSYSSNFTLDTHITRGITFTKPTNKTVFTNGDNLIQWFTIGPIYEIGIELYHDGTFLDTIDSYETNVGMYTWKLYADDIYENSSSYQIKITDKNSGFFIFSDNFTIDIDDKNVEPYYPLLEVIIMSSLFGGIGIVVIVFGTWYILHKRKLKKELEELT